MTNMFKKALVFSLLGVLLTGIGASTTEASAKKDHNNNAQRYEQHDNKFNSHSNRDHHIQQEREQRQHEMQEQREHGLQEERKQRDREIQERHRDHHEDNDNDKDLVTGLGALALLAVILDNN